MGTQSVLLVLLTLVLFGSVIALGVLYFRKHQAYRAIYERLSGIADVELERKRVQKEHAKFLEEQSRTSQALREDYERKRAIYERLVREVSVLEENLDDISYGLYSPDFSFDTPEQYKQKLTEIRQEQKQMLRAKQATTCAKEWTVEGSKKEGKKMVERTSKLILRAFNGECDAAVAKVRWNNVQKMIERVEKAFEAINLLGAPLQIGIAQQYLYLKLKEVRLAHEHHEKVQEEKEEQRRIREQMREEEKVRRDIEKAREQAEKEENDYQQALARARRELEGATGERLRDMNEKIAMLEKQLAEAQEMKQRAISRAQQTRSGHVYIISNVGSFGDKVFKIGLTRRLEPLDRVKELGDASVPFPFDIHAMVFSEDAVELEGKLHQYFDKRRMNPANERKEFFRATLDEIEKVVRGLHAEVEFTKVVEAREYRETLALRKATEERREEPVAGRFPDTFAAPEAPPAGTPTPTPPPPSAPLSGNPLELVGETGTTLRCSTRTDLGKTVWAPTGPDAQRFLDVKQCTVAKNDSGQWVLTPNPSAPNETLINAKAVTAPTVLRQGDAVAVGRESKGIVKLPMHVDKA